MLDPPNTKQSGTRDLPWDLWSAIFQLACPASDEFFEETPPMPPFHLVLRSVSTLWYGIVHSTPQLWTFVFLPKLCPENLDSKGQYLKLFLESSGSLPLTLCLQFDDKLSKIDSFISPVDDTTLELATHRIRSLRVSQPPHNWLEKLIPRMCHLATIQLINPHRSDSIWAINGGEIFFPKFANISRIRILRPCLRGIYLDCVTSSITHVDLFSCPFDFAMEILLRCPNLIDYRCLFAIFALKRKEPRTMFTSPLTLSHLSTFSWTTSQSSDGIYEWDTALFEHIRFPALKRFNWWPGRHLSTNDAPLALLFSRFPKSITTLELHGRYFNDRVKGPALHRIFPSLTGVTQLRLHNWHRVGDALSFLLRRADQSNVLFPNLKAIVLDYQVAHGETPPWPVLRPLYGPKLVHMLRSRIGLMDEFMLTVEMAHLTRKWDDEVWDGLRQLKQDGLDLTIIEYGHPITI